MGIGKQEETNNSGGIGGTKHCFFFVKLLQISCAAVTSLFNNAILIGRNNTIGKYSFLPQVKLKIVGFDQSIELLYFLDMRFFQIL